MQNKHTEGILISMKEVTTIKVTKLLRDRITAAAAERHQTVQRFIEGVMDERDRVQRLQAVADAIAEADVEDLSTWRTETADWSALDNDLDGPK